MAEQVQIITQAAAASGVAIHLTLHNDQSTHTHGDHNEYHGDHNEYHGGSNNGVSLSEQLRQMERNIIQEIRTIPERTVARQRMDGEQKHQRRPK